MSDMINALLDRAVRDRYKAIAERDGLLVELRDWAHGHAALVAGRGNVDDIDGFIAWAKSPEAGAKEPRE